MSFTETSTPSTPDPAAGSGAADGVQTATVPPSEATEPVTDTSTQSTDDTQVEKFDRDYVEKLRREAAERRKSVQKYEQAFEGYSPEEQEAFLDIAKGLADPNTSVAQAKRLKEIADNIIAAHEDGRSTRPTGEEDPDERPLTMKEWKAMQAEREQAEAIKAIESEAKALGIEPGTVDYSDLLFFAQDPDVGGDLAKAKTKLEEHWAEKSKALASKLQNEAQKWPGGVVTAPNTGAADAEGGKKALSGWKAARMAAMAHINARPGSVRT